MESERVFPQTDAEVDAAVQQEKDEHKRIQEQVKMSQNDPVERKEGEPEVVKPTHLKVSVTEDDDCDVCDEEASSGSEVDMGNYSPYDSDLERELRTEKRELKAKAKKEVEKAKRKADKDKPKRKCQECESVLTPRRDLSCCVCKLLFVCEKCCGAGFTGDTCAPCEVFGESKPKKIKKDKPARLGTKRPVIITERRRRVFHPSVHMLEVNGLHFPLLHTDSDAERFVTPGIIRLCTAARKHGESKGVSSKAKRFEVSVFSALANGPIELELEDRQVAQGMSFVNEKHNVSVLLVKDAKDMLHPVEVHVPISMLHADDPALLVATKSQ